MAKLGTVALIGLGNMGEAILSGLLDRKMVKPGDVLGVEARKDQANKLARRYGIRIAPDVKSAASEADLLVLAVKPKDAAKALAQAGDLSGRLLVSICAGLTLGWLESKVSPKAAVVRVMPNTPALAGEGASVYCVGKSVGVKQAALVEALLGAVGKVYRVEDEALMDAVTGLSGSGPAYVFTFLEALADGGVAAGLPRDLARALAAQTVLGSARMAQTSAEHTAELKDRVTSPGGTTAAGLKALEDGKFRATVMEAVTAATRRSRELGG